MEDHLHLLEEIAALGGRALQAALDRQQISQREETWRWLAESADETAGLLAGCRSRAMQEVASMVSRVAPEDGDRNLVD